MAKATEPIYTEKQFKKIMLYWRGKNIRNFTIICAMYLTALRVSDLIRLKWSDFFIGDDMSVKLLQDAFASRATFANFFS